MCTGEHCSLVKMNECIQQVFFLKKYHDSDSLNTKCQTQQIKFLRKKNSQFKGVQKCCKSKTCVCLFVFQIAQLGSFSTSFTMPSLGTLSPEKFFPNGYHRDTLTNTYCVLLGKIQII